LDIPSGQRSKTNMKLLSSQSLTWTLKKMNGLNWRGEAPTWIWESEGSGEILYGGMVSDLLLGVFQTHQALQEKSQRLAIASYIWNPKIPPCPLLATWPTPTPKHMNEQSQSRGCQAPRGTASVIWREFHQYNKKCLWKTLPTPSLSVIHTLTRAIEW